MEQVTARTNPGPEERRFGYVSDGHSYLLGSSALREERERKSGSEIKVEGGKGSDRLFVAMQGRTGRKGRKGRAYTRRWVGDYRSPGTQMESYAAAAAKYRVWGSNSRNRSPPVHPRWKWKETEPLKPSNFDRHPFILEERE